MDSRSAIIQKIIQLILVFLYRAFFDQDVEEHGFEHPVTGAQMVDPAE
jgi:hypothetical protein